MPIHVKVLDANSKFCGFAQGNCEVFDTTNNTVMKGNFVNSVLTGPNNELIQYTNTSFLYFIGEFLNNQPDGNMLVYEYDGDGTLLQNISAPIIVQKKQCVYNAGTLISTSSTQDVSATINIDFCDRYGTIFLTKFDIAA